MDDRWDLGWLTGGCAYRTVFEMRPGVAPPLLPRAEFHLTGVPDCGTVLLVGMSWHRLGTSAGQISLFTPMSCRTRSACPRDVDCVRMNRDAPAARPAARGRTTRTTEGATYDHRTQNRLDRFAFFTAGSTSRTYPPERAWNLFTTARKEEREDNSESA